MLSVSDYDSPSKLKNFLDEQGLSMQKRFGQNFLINRAAREKIADSLDISSGMRVWEVGAGLGALSGSLLERGAVLTAFEIDRGFAALLPGFFEVPQNDGRFTLVEGDVLKNWQSAIIERGLPERFCGNLPYNIAATLIADTICAGVRFSRCVFTVQKEVALRMAAREGSADYSAFSVLCQWAYKVKSLFDLAPGNFWPRPEVDSRVVLFEPRADFLVCKDTPRFVRLVHAAFAHRRKTIKNNLAAFFGGTQQAEAALESAGINPTARAETVSVEGLLRLVDNL
jgi:16S rRNA (adenine1518-N6/adenine1519-N6)-dimethyltransferase